VSASSLTVMLKAAAMMKKGTNRSTYSSGIERNHVLTNATFSTGAKAPRAEVDVDDTTVDEARRRCAVAAGIIVDLSGEETFPSDEDRSSEGSCEFLRDSPK
jgi:hypothetical protein